MEMHSNLYYRHADAQIMSKLDRLFQEHRGDASQFTALVCDINPEHGAELAEDILNTVDNVAVMMILGSFGSNLKVMNWFVKMMNL